MCVCVLLLIGSQLLELNQCSPAQLHDVVRAAAAGGRWQALPASNATRQRGCEGAASHLGSSCGDHTASGCTGESVVTCCLHEAQLHIAYRLPPGNVLLVLLLLHGPTQGDTLYTHAWGVCGAAVVSQQHKLQLGLVRPRLRGPPGFLLEQQHVPCAFTWPCTPALHGLTHLTVVPGVGLVC